MSFGLIRVSWIDTDTKGSEENRYIAETREIRQTKGYCDYFIRWRDIANYRKIIDMVVNLEERLLPIILPIPLEA